MGFDKDTPHETRVDITQQIFQESEFNWNVKRVTDDFSADLIVEKEDVAREPEFALVVSSGNFPNALRKMNFFSESNYYWAFVPCRDEEITSLQREWCRGLGVAWCDVTADKAELIITYSNNDAKLPVNYANEKIKERYLPRLGWDESCLEHLEKYYKKNTWAFKEGEGDPDIRKKQNKFQLTI